jgi:hypothetical protein
MTTIAWDGKTLASDGRVSVNGMLSADNADKIFMIEDAYLRGSEVICFACAGDASVRNLIEEWIREECPRDFISPTVMYECIIVTTDAVYHTSPEQADIYQLTEGEYGVIGSGAEIAHTALVMGKDAKGAVAVACSLDLCSGGQIAYVNCRAKSPTLRVI